MRFNTKNIDKSVTTNYEGAKAYKVSAELELYSLVATASLQNKFYEGTDKTLERIRTLITKVSPEFVAKLAIYTREEMYLRSVPLVLTVELAKIHKGDRLIQKLSSRVIQRADEITELLSYYQLANKRTDTKKLNGLSKQLQKGIAQAFNKFNEYAFGKYDRQGSVTLKDALFLSHPKGKDKEQEALFKKIADGTLETPYTWEVELSSAGKEGKDKKIVWEELIESKKLGFMALLRNLRNILDANVSSKHMTIVCERLINKEEVLKSKQLPFRFFSAYRELENNTNPFTSMVLTSLEEAVLHTANNIKGYDINTSVCIACDVSGSMETPVSPKSKVEYFDIGLMLGMLLQQSCKNVTTGIFGDTWKIKNLPKNSILQNVILLHRKANEVGYSTNGYLVITDLIKRKVKVDKIMIFTDCELWDSYYNHDLESLWYEYKAFNPTAKMYLFNMAGYGTTPVRINEKDTYMISGWSDKIFDILYAIENSSNAIVEINKIKI